MPLHSFKCRFPFPHPEQFQESPLSRCSCVPLKPWTVSDHHSCWADVPVVVWSRDRCWNTRQSHHLAHQQYYLLPATNRDRQPSEGIGLGMNFCSAQGLMNRTKRLSSLQVNISSSSPFLADLQTLLRKDKKVPPNITLAFHCTQIRTGMKTAHRQPWQNPSNRKLLFLKQSI